MDCLQSDVVVIGGGIVGSFTALRLAQRGKKVCLLDKGSLFNEASGRNGGGVRQQFRKSAELPLAIRAIDIWKSLCEEFGVDLEYRRKGSLKLYRDGEDLEAIHDRVRRERELGINVSFLDPDVVRAKIPFLSTNVDVVGATHCTTDGTANPLVLGRVISRVLARAGVNLCLNEPAVRLIVDNDRVVKAESRDRQFEAKTFVVAAGPWSKEICRTAGITLHTSIRKTPLFISEPVSPVIPGFISFDGGYMRQARDGNLHMGVSGDVIETVDKEVTMGSLTRMGQKFPEWFPFTDRLNIIRGFTGITTWTPDGTPIIDQAPGLKGLYIATGFSGHGFCIGPVVGELLTQWILDGEPWIDLSAFDCERFDVDDTMAGQAVKG